MQLSLISQSKQTFCPALKSAVSGSVVTMGRRVFLTAFTQSPRLSTAAEISLALMGIAEVSVTVCSPGLSLLRKIFSGFMIYAGVRLLIK